MILRRLMAIVLVFVVDWGLYRFSIGAKEGAIYILVSQLVLQRIFDLIGFFEDKK